MSEGVSERSRECGRVGSRVSERSRERELRASSSEFARSCVGFARSEFVSEETASSRVSERVSISVFVRASSRKRASLGEWCGSWVVDVFSCLVGYFFGEATKSEQFAFYIVLHHWGSVVIISFLFVSCSLLSCHFFASKSNRHQSIGWGGQRSVFLACQPLRIRCQSALAWASAMLRQQQFPTQSVKVGRIS